MAERFAKRLTTKRGALGIPCKRWQRALKPWSLDPDRGATKLDPASAAYERFQQRHDWRGAPAWLAEDLGISRRRLLEATEGLPFRRDFGRGRRAWVAFHVTDMLKWALRA